MLKLKTRNFREERSITLETKYEIGIEYLMAKS
jgi:hypothetical protein